MIFCRNVAADPCLVGMRALLWGLGARLTGGALKEPAEPGGGSMGCLPNDPSVLSGPPSTEGVGLCVAGGSAASLTGAVTVNA